MSSRDAILARLRAVRRPAPAPVGPYRPVPVPDLVQRFRERIGTVFGSAEVIGTVSDLPEAVARFLGEHGLPSNVAIAAEFGGLSWNGAGLAAGARPSRQSMEVAVGRVPLAIAETGSLLMSSRDPDDPWPNLLADTHLAVVNAGDIVASFEEAVARMAGNRLPRSLHVATGPSRTGDIEQTLELGAHGAVRVHVFIVAEG